MILQFCQLALIIIMINSNTALLYVKAIVHTPRLLTRMDRAMDLVKVRFIMQ